MNHRERLPDPRIRLVRESDAEHVLDIYAPIVRDTPYSFELEPPPIEEMHRKIREGLAFAPWLVLEINDRIAAFAYGGPFRTRAAYRWTVETTVHVRDGFRGRGIGRAIYESLIACLRVQGFHMAIAVVAESNPASARLHEAVGFRRIGVFHEVGFKLGTWHNSTWWELRLSEPTNEPAPPKPMNNTVNAPEWMEAMYAGLKYVR